jgi:hypothetical protein
MRISAKINLRQLKSHVMTMKTKSGEPIECVVLPIEQNHIFKSEKSLFLDFQLYELREKREDQTHLIKQNFSKVYYDSLSEDEKNKLPIIGSAILWGKTEPEPRTFEVLQNEPNEPGLDENGLPF